MAKAEIIGGTLMKRSFINGMRSDDISMRLRRNRVDDTYYARG